MMMRIKIFVCLVVLLSLNMNLKANDKEILMDLYLQTSLKVVNEIICESKDIILSQESEQIYIKPEAIMHRHLGSLGAILKMDQGDVTYIPLLFEDEKGFYIPITLRKVGSKLFKLHCNNCYYEWEGRVWDFQCPSCNSTDIQTLPNF